MCVIFVLSRCQKKYSKLYYYFAYVLSLNASNFFFLICAFNILSPRVLDIRQSCLYSLHALASNKRCLCSELHKTCRENKHSQKTHVSANKDYGWRPPCIVKGRSTTYLILFKETIYRDRYEIL